jgi:hypothetical protein
MIYRHIFCSAPIKLVLGLLLTGCVTQKGAEPLESARDIPGAVSVGQPSKYLLLPGNRTYAILASPLITGHFVAEVKLYEGGEELGRLLEEDSRRTGEGPFTMLSENLAVEELNGARPRLSWWGDVLRGFGSSVDTPLRQNVHAVVVRRLTPPSVGSKASDCPILIFGDRDSLYTITANIDGIHTVERVQLSAGIRNMNQAEALINGTCLTPEFDRLASLRPYQRAGRVRGSNGKLRLIWSRLETIAGF